MQPRLIVGGASVTPAAWLSWVTFDLLRLRWLANRYLTTALNCMHAGFANRTVLALLGTEHWLACTLLMSVARERESDVCIGDLQGAEAIHELCRKDMVRRSQRTLYE